MYKLNKKEKKTYQSCNRCGQPVNPLDNTRLDLVDQTVSNRKRKRERENMRERKRVSESTWSLARLV